MRNGLRSDERVLAQPATIQQRLQFGVTTAEIAECFEWILRAADTEKFRSKTVAIGPREPAIFGEPLNRVGIQHFAPNVGVVASIVGRVCEDVLKVGA